MCFIRIFFFLSSLFYFLSVFSLTDTNDSQDRREERGNHYFSCSSLPPVNIHLVHRDFSHFFLIDLFVIVRLIVVYLSHLPNPTSSHYLSSIRLLKCIRNEACFINKFSPLIIYLDFKATMTTHKLIKKCSYRQSCHFSDWIGLQPFSDIIIADNKMAVAILPRERANI